MQIVGSPACLPTQQEKVLFWGGLPISKNVSASKPFCTFVQSVTKKPFRTFEMYTFKHHKTWHLNRGVLTFYIHCVCMYVCFTMHTRELCIKLYEEFKLKVVHE